MKISVISPTELRSLTKSAKVVPIDATWYMPNVPKNGKEEFAQVRLPGARFFDVDGVSSESPYPHMLPKYGQFRDAIKQLGIEKSDHLVFYDKQGIFSSPRAAWSFSLFGHKNVYLLDNYLKYDGPVETDSPVRIEPAQESFGPSEYASNYSKEVVEFEELLDLVKSNRLTSEYFLFDARSHDRFTGKSPEPREGLSSGHVPGSLSLPFSKLLSSGYKSREELLELFKQDFGLNLSTPAFLGNRKGVIVMCGSGVTAVIVKLAIQSIIGADVLVRVYDGSWTEWASRAPSEYIEKSD